MTKAITPVHQVIYNGATLNVYHTNKGQGLPRHEHTFSHLTICHSGSLIVRKEGRELIITKETQPVDLVGGEWHEIEALEDNTVFVNLFSEGKH